MLETGKHHNAAIFLNRFPFRISRFLHFATQKSAVPFLVSQIRKVPRFEPSSIVKRDSAVVAAKFSSPVFYNEDHMTCATLPQVCELTRLKGKRN
jgi:hypothetical protein